MNYPNLHEEKYLWKRGFKRVASLDEAGRGPLAGPVVAGAVVLNSKSDLGFKSFGIKDSKKLSAKKRKEFYRLIKSNKKIEWGIGIVSEKTIDRINILEATKLAMEKAVKKLGRKPDFLVLDGKMRINLEIPQKSIIKADEKVLSCAMASILAKVTRDRIMMRYHKKYPKYRFDLHKGYPTKLHRKLLKKYGCLVIHRKTFTPVLKALKLNNG